MPVIVKYFWPMWIFIIFQFSWNIVLAFHLGDNFGVGNWMFGRACYGTKKLCASDILIFSIWGILGTLFVVNLVVNLLRNNK